MSNQDLITYKYQFTIIPLLLITKTQQQLLHSPSNNFTQTPSTLSSSSSLHQKQLSIKLVNLTQKTNQINKPLIFPITVYFSKKQQKYLPIKCYIKIYDLLSDNSQIISSVTTIQIQNILQNKIKQSIITKSIGHDLIKLQIHAKNLNQINQIILKQSLHIIPPIELKNNSDDSFQQISSQNMIINSSGQICVGQQFSHTNSIQSQIISPIASQILPIKTTTNSSQLLVDLKNAVNFGLSKTKFNINHVNITTSTANNFYTHNKNTFNNYFYNSNNKLINKIHELRKNNNHQNYTQKQFPFLSKNKQQNTNIIKKIAQISHNTTQNLYQYTHTQSKSTIKQCYYKQNVADDDYQDQYYNTQLSMIIDSDIKNNKQIKQLSTATTSKDQEHSNKQQLSVPPIVTDIISSNQLQYGQSPINSAIITSNNNDIIVKNNKHIPGKIDDDFISDNETATIPNPQRYQKNINTSTPLQQNIANQLSTKPPTMQNQSQITSSFSLIQCQKSVDLSAGQMIKSICNIANGINLPHVQSVSSSCYASPNHNQRHNIVNQNLQNTHGDTQLTISNTMTITSILTHPQHSREQKLQLQILGQQLIQQRRKNIQYQQKIQKLNQKICNNKLKFQKFKDDWKQWCCISQLFIDKMIKNPNDQYIIQISKQKQSITFKYKINNQNQQIFLKFLTITLKNCKNLQKLSQNKQHQKPQHQNKSKQKQKSSQPSQFPHSYSPTLPKILQQTPQQSPSQSRLKQQLQQKITTLTTSLKTLQQSYHHLLSQKQKYHHLSTIQTKSLQQLKQQLSILKQKQHTQQSLLQHIKSKLQQNNNQMDILDDQIIQYKNNLSNKQLIIQQLKQQLSNQQQIIQTYKNIYGQIKQYQQYNLIKFKHSNHSIELSNHQSIHQQKNNNGNNQKSYSLISNSISNSFQNFAFHQPNQSIIIKNSMEKTTRPNILLSLSTKQSILNNSSQNQIISSQIIKQSKNKQQKSIKFLSQKKLQYNNKNILLSIIRNQQKIYKYKHHQLINIQKQLSSILNNIQLYAKKIQNNYHLSNQSL